MFISKINSRIIQIELNTRILVLQTLKRGKNENRYAQLHWGKPYRRQFNEVDLTLGHVTEVRFLVLTLFICFQTF